MDRAEAASPGEAKLEELIVPGEPVTWWREPPFANMSSGDCRDQSCEHSCSNLGECNSGLDAEPVWRLKRCVADGPALGTHGSTKPLPVAPLLVSTRVNPCAAVDSCSCEDKRDLLRGSGGTGEGKMGPLALRPEKCEAVSMAMLINTGQTVQP